jgi:DNA repair protein RecO (recombination protein O)
MRINLEPAFVLHSRPYRETSVLLDLFTHEHGRISVIAKGVRSKRSRLKSLLQPFVPLLISWQGKGELGTLTGAEGQGYYNNLNGECLLSGLYLNELLMRVLHKFDPQPGLYTIYQKTLLELQGEGLQKTLRLFEKKLLEEIGYGLQLLYAQPAGTIIDADHYYHFHPEHGFEYYGELNKTAGAVFSGKSLLAIAADQLDDETVQRDCKRLMRLALAPLLGKNPLQSRKLYLHRTMNKDEQTENNVDEVDPA